MRHKVYGKHLSRDKDQRTALFKSLVRSLILEESIKTTQPKAKAVKGLVDKIITQAKSETSKRLVSQFLIHKPVEEKLIKVILPRVKSRTSGYTSVVKLGPRLGDGAMMVKLSLILDAIKEPIKKSEPKKEEKEGVKAKVKNQNAKIQVKS
ncbi:MAG TPA: 50S ribosomal protein L17 [Patescibacteria group bacterium]|nr:50S ribosomal protein L17 [Patescibacteria group bacterium]